MVQRPIPAPVLGRDNRFLQFSFKYLQLDHERFKPANEPGFFIALLERVKEFETWGVDEFRDPNHGESRHPIDFEGTFEPEGFRLPVSGDQAEQLAYAEDWQFAIDVRSTWRVYGFLLENIFHLVWLDAKHCLFKKSRS